MRAAQPHHEPKTAALLAYKSLALSPRGRARVEKHLLDCDECRRSLAAMHGYDTLVDEVRGAEAPSVDWSRMELALAREARAEARKARGARLRPAWAALALAAAAVLAVLAAREHMKLEPATRLPDVVVAPEAALDRRAEALASAPVKGEVTTVAFGPGGAGARAAGEAARVGSVVEEGALLETFDGARLDARLADGTGISLASSTSVRVSVLRAERVELALGTGAVSSQVRHLGSHGTYVVHAGGYEVAVRGTRFAVSAVEGGRVGVVVDEGVVEVRQAEYSAPQVPPHLGADASPLASLRALEAREVHLRARAWPAGRLDADPGAELAGRGTGGVVALVTAPGRWQSPSPDVELAALAVVAPRGVERDASTWSILNLPLLGGVSEWRFDGSTFDATGRLAVRVPQGSLEVTSIDRRGVQRSSMVVIGPDDAELSPEAIRALEPSAPPSRNGYLSPELIRPVVRAGERDLARCQRETEQRGFDVSGRMAVRVTIDRTGAVASARVVSNGEAGSDVLTTCIEAEIGGWSFPPPSGGTVTFDLPLSFSHSGPGPAHAR